MGSTKRKRLNPEEVPLVLYANVSEKVLRRGVASRLLFRSKGRALQLYDGRGRARRRSSQTRVMLRIAGRAAALSGVRFYANGARGQFDAESVPIKFAACNKLPYALKAVPIVDAAGGIVVTTEKRPRVLLLRKRDGRTNRWVLPKGKRQSREARRQAARREVLEESGLARIDVGPYLLRERYFDVESGRVVFKEVSYYLMRCAKGRTRLKVNRDEGFDSGLWMPFTRAMGATNPVRCHRSLRKARSALRMR